MIKDNQNYNDNVEPNTEFLNELKNKLPEYFSKDGEFNLEKFKSKLIENNINELKDGYQLNFIGKDYARRQSGEIPTTVVVPDEEQNNGEGKDSSNLFFTGDNIEVLRHLQGPYTSKIDMIYVDPPYNTGKNDFIYPDNFEYSDEKLQNMFGLDENELLKLKSIQGKSSHSAWMTFMYPRLVLMKKLLNDTGYICISIDDNEQSNLKNVMDEIFGEDNFIANIIVDGTPKNDPLLVSTSHEYVLVYVKNINYAKTETWGSPHKLTEKLMEIVDGLSYDEAEEKLKKFYTDNGLSKDNIHNYKFVDEDGIYRIGPIDDPQGRGPKDDRINPNTGNPCLIPERGWSCTIDTWDEWKKNNLIYFPKDDTSQPSKKTYLNTDKLDVIRSVQKIQTRSSTNYLKNIFNNKKVFNNPKPINLIEELINAMNKKNPVILDPFAGSSTTADAVMRLNAKDGNNRSYIMIQIPEKIRLTNGKTNSISKNALDLGFSSIDEISRERIKKSEKYIQEKVINNNEDFYSSFKHYRVTSPKSSTLEKIEDFDPNKIDLFNDMVDSFSSESLGLDLSATGEDTVVSTWLLSDGYQLNSEVKDVDFSGYVGKLVNNETLYLVNEGWNSDNTKSLLNHLGEYELSIKNIIVFGYSFNIAEIKELEIGLKQLDMNVNLLKRY